MRQFIIIPAYNEEKTIGRVVEKCKRYGKVYVVDDGSTDSTEKKVRAISNIKVISIFPNQGKGIALKVAFEMLKGTEAVGEKDNIILIDGDGQHNPDHIPRLLEKLKKTDMVIGQRDLSGYPPYKKFGNWFLSLVVSSLSKIKIRDTECGFKVMKWKVVRDLLEFSKAKKYGFESESVIITALRGHKIDFVKVPSHYKKGVGFWDGVSNFTVILSAYSRCGK